MILILYGRKMYFLFGIPFASRVGAGLILAKWRTGLRVGKCSSFDAVTGGLVVRVKVIYRKPFNALKSNWYAKDTFSTFSGAQASCC